VPYKISWCTVDICSAQPCVQSCDVRCAPPPPKPLTPFHPSHLPPPYASHCRLSLLAAEEGVDLDGAHQESLRATKSVTSGCRTMYVNITIYFPSPVLSCGTLLKYCVCLALIVIIFLGWLIKTTDKSFHVRCHVFLARVMYTSFYFFSVPPSIPPYIIPSISPSTLLLFPPIIIPFIPISLPLYVPVTFLMKNRLKWFIW
jgi:hypothetical protein